jgi:hypothetical protein
MEKWSVFSVQPLPTVVLAARSKVSEKTVGFGGPESTPPVLLLLLLLELLEVLDEDEALDEDDDASGVPEEDDDDEEEEDEDAEPLDPPLAELAELDVEVELAVAASSSAIESCVASRSPTPLIAVHAINAAPAATVAAARLSAVTITIVTPRSRGVKRGGHP